MSVLRCADCQSIVESLLPKYRCPSCGGLLEYKLNYEQLKEARFKGDFTFWRYRDVLPKVKNPATMREGGTPLHKAKRLAKEMNLNRVYLKDETRNPTNSFRDRAAALLVSNALDLDFATMICATNGNLGASLSAYCAKYGIMCHVIIPELVDMGKLAQMLIYDAVVDEYGETVDKSIGRAEKLAEETGWYQATSELNPLAMEAQKTIAFEVAEQFGVPEWFIVSMGSGGTIYSIWKGFRELHELGRIKTLPKMVGVQAEGCSPIADDYLNRKKKSMKPTTHAIGILVGNPLQSRLAVRAIKESKGIATLTSDQEIFLAEQEVARMEGIFAEPASSGTIAALKKLRNESVIDEDDTVTCLITGSGLKATDVLQALSKKRKTAIVGAEFSTKEKILLILNRRDAYGYELWKLLGKTMTRSAVYQHLNDLLERGLVAAYDEKGRRYFKITNRGRRVLHALDELKTLV